MALLVPFISGTSLGLPSHRDLGSDSIFARLVNFIMSWTSARGWLQPSTLRRPQGKRGLQITQLLQKPMPRGWSLTG